MAEAHADIADYQGIAAQRLVRIGEHQLFRADEITAQHTDTGRDAYDGVHQQIDGRCAGTYRRKSRVTDVLTGNHLVGNII